MVAVDNINHRQYDAFLIGQLLKYKYIVYFQLKYTITTVAAADMNSVFAERHIE